MFSKISSGTGLTLSNAAIALLQYTLLDKQSFVSMRLMHSPYASAVPFIIPYAKILEMKIAIAHTNRRAKPKYSLGYFNERQGTLDCRKRHSNF